MAGSIPPQMSRAKNGETTIVVLYRLLTPGWKDGVGKPASLGPGVYHLTGTRIESGTRYFLLDGDVWIRALDVPVIAVGVEQPAAMAAPSPH